MATILKQSPLVQYKMYVFMAETILAETEAGILKKPREAYVNTFWNDFLFTTLGNCFYY